MKNIKILFLFVVIMISTELFAGENKKAAGPRLLRPQLAGETISEEALKQLRENTRNLDTGLSEIACCSHPDSQHTVSTTYDFGWNSHTRNMVKADGSGGVHIAITQQELLNNSDRRVTYHYNLGKHNENVADVTAPGEFAYMPTIYTSDTDEAWINVRVRQDLGTPAGTNSFYRDLLPGLGLFIGSNGYLGIGDVGPFAMSSITHRAWYLVTDSQKVAWSEDGGANWTLTGGSVWDERYWSSWTSSGIQTSFDGAKVALFETFYNAEFAPGDTVPNVHLYSVSEDSGESWTVVPVYWSGLRADGSADPFITKSGISDTLYDGWTGPWMGGDLVFDYLGNVHMVYPSFALQPSDTVAPYVYGSPILHYSSARGEGVANMVELTDSRLSHSVGYSAAVDSGNFVGNGIGFGVYPSIASAPDGPIMIAIWVQPDMDGTVGGTNVAVTGYWVTDVWGAVSYDAGETWSAPFQITSTPNVAENWTTLDPYLEPLGDGAYYYHALWFDDRSPGISLFGEGDSSMDSWVYAPGYIGPIGIVEDNNGALFRSFSLLQNFPNPFNPVTKISYALPLSSEVSLIIYNLLGEEVIRLVDSFQQAGEYNAIWNASNVSSGIYFYRLRSGNFVQTRKMVLLK